MENLTRRRKKKHLNIIFWSRRDTFLTGDLSNYPPQLRGETYMFSGVSGIVVLVDLCRPGICQQLFDPKGHKNHVKEKSVKPRYIDNRL